MVYACLSISSHQTLSINGRLDRLDEWGDNLATLRLVERGYLLANGSEVWDRYLVVARVSKWVNLLSPVMPNFS